MVSVYRGIETDNGIKINTDLVKMINLSTSNFSSVEELEYFKNLEIINLNKTRITRVNLDLPKLKELYCNNTFLTEINLEKNPNLKILECSYSELKNLDLELNDKLIYLNSENSNELNKIFIWDLSIPSAFKWKKSQISKYSLKPIKIEDFQLVRFLKTITYLTYENEMVYINKSEITKIDIKKYYKDNDIIEIDCIKSLVGIENFPNLEIVNINDTKGIKKLDLSKNINLKILNAQNSDLEELNISNNMLLEKINLENTKITNLKLPNIKEIINTEDPQFEILGNNGIFNTITKRFVGRMVNDNDIYQYKSFYLGFESEVNYLFKNEINLYEKILNNTNYTVIVYDEVIKDCYDNLFEGLPFTLLVYKSPDTSVPKKYNFKYSNKYSYHPYLITEEKINIWDIEFSYLVEINFNYPINEEFRVMPFKLSYIDRPIDNAKYNFYLYNDNQYFKKYESVYIEEKNYFKMNKSPTNINNKYKVLISNSNLDLLNVKNCQINSVNLEKFTFIKTLNVAKTNLENLDVNKNTLLVKIVANNNFIKSLNLSNNINLEEIYINNNYIKEIDFKNNSDLRIIDISNNLLESLDVSNNLLLKKLNCSINKINYLDISKNINLEKLICFNNSFTKVNTSNNKKLISPPEDIGEVILTNEFIDDNEEEIILNIDYYNKYIGESIFTANKYLLNKITFKSNILIEPEYIPIENSMILVKDSYELFVVKEKIFSELRVGLGFSKFEYSINELGKTKLFQNTDGNKFYLFANSNNINKRFKYLTIKDKGFRNYLIKLGARKYKDEMIYLDVNNIYHIDISYSPEIISIEEIKEFPNLLSLNCSSCNISKLDISENKKLLYLNCGNNYLTELEFKNNQSLKVIFLDNNNFTNINLSENKEVIYLNCISNSNLEIIDLNNYNNHKLEKFKAYKCFNIKRVYLDSYKNTYGLPKNCIFVENQFHSHLIEKYKAYYKDNQLIYSEKDLITRFTLKNEELKNLKGIEVLTYLEELFIDCSPIEEVNTENNFYLTTINITDSDVISLDFSNNVNLENVILKNNKVLTSLNLCNNNNNKIKKLKITNCPKLKEILIDKRMDRIPDSWEVDTSVKFLFCEDNEFKLLKII